MLWPSVTRVFAGLALAQAGRWKQHFIHSTKSCTKTQSNLLRRILHDQHSTLFGREYDFSSIRTPADYRKRVPVHRYEDLALYINKVRQGQTDALLADPFIHMFALTSGTTAIRKYIPVTRQYLKDYRRGTNIWARGIFEKHPKAFFKPILQLVSDWDETRSETNIPCGNISGLTSHMQSRPVQACYCMPAVTGKINDATSKLYLALRMGLMQKELGILASANPSTLVRLGQLMETHHDDLFRDLHDGTIRPDVAIFDSVRQALQSRLTKMPERARELQTIRQVHGRLTPEHAWDAIHTIGCWTGGSVGLYLKQFPHYYGNTPVRDLGLLASEGRMTIPLDEGTTGGVLDIRSHYFEFIHEGEIDSARPITLTTEELAIGQNYYIVPTTSYGLYRYNLFDVVRVIDYFHSTPVVEFLNKGSLFSNLTGEKLSEFQVVAAMKKVSHRWRSFPAAYTIAPYWDERSPGYSLYMEEQDVADVAPEVLATEFDKCLREQNIEYATKRDSQRLSMLEICLLPRDTWSRWDAARLAKAGGSSEQYKHPCLINDVQFKTTMPVMKTVSGRAPVVLAHSV